MLIKGAFVLDGMVQSRAHLHKVMNTSIKADCIFVSWFTSPHFEAWKFNAKNCIISPKKYICDNKTTQIKCCCIFDYFCHSIWILNFTCKFYKCELWLFVSEQYVSRQGQKVAAVAAATQIIPLQGKRPTSQLFIALKESPAFVKLPTAAVNIVHGLDEKVY